MYCKRAAVPLFLILAACGPKAPAAPVQLAIVRFENLGADASTDWMGRALSEIIAAELPANLAISSARLHSLDRTLGVRPVSAPGISTERSAAILSGANRIGYGQYAVRNGRVEARLTIEDPQSGRTMQVLSTSTNDVMAAADDLARQLSPIATRYRTRSLAAVERYITALESGNADAMSQGAAAAIAADPDFGPAYLLLADVKAQQHDRDGALATLDQALARGSAISASERGRIELQAASLRNDLAARQQALDDIARSDPTNADSWRAVGESAYARRDYPHAVEAYQKALQLHPDDATVLNLFGYAQAFAGDFDGALRTLRRYQSLQPKDANPLDSQGDINLMCGRLREAEELYLQAYKLDPKSLGAGDLLKAAIARLMTGDVPGASTLAGQYTDARTALHDPGVPIQQAEWSWISGRHKAAVDQMESLAAAKKELAARAYTDLAIWSLLDGDRTAAAQWSQKAGAVVTPSSAADAIVARFLSLPRATAAEWSTRADQLFHNVPQSEVKDLTLAYAFLLDRHFAEASVVLRRLYNSSAVDPGIPVLLAWSLLETGHAEEAAPLLRFNPIPIPNGIAPYMGLYFPRFFDLRARLAAKSGRPDEASANLKVLQQLSPATH